MTQPNFSSNPRRISSGSEAPPEMQVRSVAVWAGSPSGACSMAAYMVGTPSKIVTVSRWMISSALAPSNLGSSVSVPPAATVAFSPQVRPKTWNSGRQPIVTSSVPFCSRVRVTRSALLVMLAWVSWAPFGLPVVPEVYKMTASSSPPRPDCSPAGTCPASRPTRSAVSATRTWAPASVAPLAASPAAVCQAISTLAPESPR